MNRCGQPLVIFGKKIVGFHTVSKCTPLTTSQLPIKSWYEQINDQTFADAILDRLLGQAQILSLSGPSMRKKAIQNQGGVN